MLNVDGSTDEPGPDGVEAGVLSSTTVSPPARAPLPTEPAETSADAPLATELAETSADAVMSGGVSGTDTPLPVDSPDDLVSQASVEQLARARVKSSKVRSRKAKRVAATLQKEAAEIEATSDPGPLCKSNLHSWLPPLTDPCTPQRQRPPPRRRPLLPRS
jgi:hypothetical protein